MSVDICECFCTLRWIQLAPFPATLNLSGHKAPFLLVHYNIQETVHCHTICAAVMLTANLTKNFHTKIVISHLKTGIESQAFVLLSLLAEAVSKNQMSSPV